MPALHDAGHFLATGYALCLAVAIAGCADAPVTPVHAPESTTDVVPASSDTTLAPSFRVRKWALDDGLPMPVFAVAQTDDGYLWITTGDGLARFDGVRFEVFTTETAPVFRSHDDVGVYVAHSGDLWVGAKDGWTYRLRKGTWTAYPIAFEEPWVQGFTEDRDGQLWAFSTGPFGARLHGDSWERLPQSVREVWPPFAADASGMLWTALDPADAPGQPVSPLGGGVVAQWDGPSLGHLRVPRDGRYGRANADDHGRPRRSRSSDRLHRTPASASRGGAGRSGSVWWRSRFAGRADPLRRQAGDHALAMTDIVRRQRSLDDDGARLYTVLSGSFSPHSPHPKA